MSEVAAIAAPAVCRPGVSAIRPDAIGTYASLDELAAHLAEPRLQSVLGHWRAACGDRRMPAQRDIDPAAMVKALPYVFIAEPLDAGDDYRVRLVGSAFEEIYGRDVTGRCLSEILPPDVWCDMKAEYAEVCRTGQPSYTQTLMPQWIGLTVFYRRLLLPLSDDDGTVNRLLGVAVFDLAPEIDPCLPSEIGRELVVRRLTGTT